LASNETIGRSRLRGRGLFHITITVVIKIIRRYSSALQGLSATILTPWRPSNQYQYHQNDNTITIQVSSLQIFLRIK